MTLFKKAAVQSILAICFFGAANAQTWQAKYLVNSTTVPISGLPPGLKFLPAGGLSTQIAGKPTVPGTYRVVVYPVKDGQIGDMIQTTITIVPNGSSTIPQYYGYLRNPLVRANGLGGFFSSYANLAMAGGGGKILMLSILSNGGRGLSFTANGTDFVAASTPGFSQGDHISTVVGASVSGGAVFIAMEGGNFIKSTGSDFSPVSQSVITTNAWHDELVSDGTSIYLFQRVSSRSTTTLRIYNTNLFSSTPTLIWTGPVTLNDLDTVSAASDGGGNTFFCAADQQYNSVLIKNASLVNNGPNNLTSVVFGNGKFLVSAQTGIYQTPDLGTSWSPLVSTSDAGVMSYENGLFFSGKLGVSNDGQNWLPFANFAESDLYGICFKVQSSGGVSPILFFGNRILASKKVPSFDSISFLPGSMQTYQATVGVPWTAGPRFQLK